MSIKLQLLVCIPPRATIRRYANPFPSRTGGTRLDLRRRSTRNRVVAPHRRCFGLVSVHGHSANCFTQVVEISRYDRPRTSRDRKSTRLNSSHQIISYAVFCLKKKKKNTKTPMKLQHTDHTST